MKLSLHQIGSSRPISHVKYSDSAVIGAVSFWANVKYQSPQFPLDLSPRFLNQLNTLYKDNQIPDIDDTTFEVTCDDDSPIKIIKIVQLKISCIDASESIPTREVWDKWFNINHQWSFVPDGSAYIIPMGHNLNMVNIKAKESTNSEYFSYDVLVAFQIDGEVYVNSKGDTVPKIFYANFDPFAKVSSGKE